MTNKGSVLDHNAMSAFMGGGCAALWNELNEYIRLLMKCKKS
jgi:hypothetical protein